LLWPRGDRGDEAFLLAILSSLPLDWYTRRFVETHVSYFVFNPLPIPRPARTDPRWVRVVELAGRLACPDERFAEWAKSVGTECGPLRDDVKLDMIHELDAVVAHLYRCPLEGDSQALPRVEAKGELNMPTATRDWERLFTTWAQPPSESEQRRCDNATRAIRAAIDASEKLNRRNITVHVQGSYRNNVNVRQESDVDVGVLCRDTFFFELPDGYKREQFNLNTPATYDYAQFKNDIGEALVAHFGYSAVHRGDKAFDVRENSYRVDADVAPFFEYRDYSSSGSYQEGMKLISDSGKVIINWPEQHYRNGVTKNDATGRAFKGIVRIVKTLGIEMEATGIPGTRDMPGFLIECMVYNVPNGHFGQHTWKKAVREVLVFLFNTTIHDEHCAKWTEVSGLKWLFHPTQKWTRQQAHAFVNAAWNYVGLE
jgi:hypothetical protein